MNTKTENISLGNDDDMPEEIKDMLMSALKGASRSAIRHKCLELALQLPDLNGPQDAIHAAEAFQTFIQGNDDDEQRH